MVTFSFITPFPNTSSLRRKAIQILPYRQITGLLLVIALFGSGCQAPGDHGPASNDTVAIQDMLGRKVQVPRKTKRVVGIGPGALRLLVYMQVTERVSGVEEIEKRTGRPYIFAHPEL